MSWKTYNTVAAAQKDRFAQAHATQICLRGSDASDEALADCLRLFPKLPSLYFAGIPYQSRFVHPEGFPGPSHINFSPRLLLLIVFSIPKENGK